MAGDSFEGIWNDPPFVVSVSADPSSDACVFAVQLQAWIDATFERSLDALDLVSINHSKLFLLDRFFQFRASLPRRHRPSSGGRNGHTCIFEVFEAAYNHLRVLELSLAPPPIVTVRPRKPQPRNRLDALIIGDLEPDPEFGLGPE